MKLAHFCLILFFIPGAKSQDIDVSSLDSAAIEIKHVSPDTDNTDLKTILPVLKDKRIVALGESTHGTKEFFEFKHRLFRFLVEEAGFKAIVFEGNFGATEVMDNYVLYGEGNPYNAVMSLGYAVWYTQEVYEMIKWIKEYNIDKEEKDKVSVYGCDLFLSKSQINELRKFVLNYDSTETIVDAFNVLSEKRTGYYHSKESSIKLREGLAEINKILESLDDTQEVNLFRQYCRVIEQYSLHRNVSKKPKRSLRDELMAENLQWLLKNKIKSGAVVWAHNGHIAEHRSSLGTRPMGSFLKQKFDDQYYSIGMLFNEGKFRAVNRDSKEPEIIQVHEANKGLGEASLNLCKYNNFFLDLSNHQLDGFLDEKKRYRGIGAVFSPSNENKQYYKSRVKKRFDSLVFFRYTTAAQRLSFDLLDRTQK